MSSISGMGSIIPPNDPQKVSLLGSDLTTYADSLTKLDPSRSDHLKTIAHQTVELHKLAQSVMHAVSPAIRSVADDLENVLQAPYSVEGMLSPVSILTASEHYISDPATAELGAVIKELHHNFFALNVMCEELRLLSGSIKNQNGPGNSFPGG